MGILDDIAPAIDDVLAMRDVLGVAKAVVNIVTRTWTGAVAGEGTATETTVNVLPSPEIRDYSQSIRLVEAGAVKRGDLILKMISKNVFAMKAEIDGTSATPNIEKFYEVNGELHTAISVTSDYLWWNVQVRRLSNQKRYT